MRTVEIKQDDKVSKDETKEAALARNLRECINIYNNIITECGDNGITMVLEVKEVLKHTTKTIDNAFTIKIIKLEKTFKQQF